MAKEEAERLMIAGGEDKYLRLRYDAIEPMDDFVALANKEGFDFTSDELKQMLKENGDLRMQKRPKEPVPYQDTDVLT